MNFALGYSLIVQRLLRRTTSNSELWIYIIGAGKHSLAMKMTFVQITRILTAFNDDHAVYVIETYSLNLYPCTVTVLTQAREWLDPYAPHHDIGEQSV
jgi:hypothetical protein